MDGREAWGTLPGVAAPVWCLSFLERRGELASCCDGLSIRSQLRGPCHLPVHKGLFTCEVKESKDPQEEQAACAAAFKPLSLRGGAQEAGAQIL